MEQNSKTQMLTVLRSTKADLIPSIPEVENRFIDLVMKVQRQPQSVAAAIFHAEQFHYLRLINDNKSLKECDQLSLYGCFLDMAINGLSFDPTKKLCYIIPENVNIGTKDSPVWQKRAKMEVSPYGELAIRQQKGQIKYADDPVIVYEGDEFKPMVKDGSKYVDYALNVNHGTTIIGAFIKIVRTDNSVDYHWLLREDIERLKGYSTRKNKGKTNELYSSQNGGIDPGFLAAKMIKHAFKSYPKVNLAGSFASFEPEQEETPEDIYGFDPNKVDAKQLPENPSPSAHALPESEDSESFAIDVTQQAPAVTVTSDVDDAETF